MEMRNIRVAFEVFDGDQYNIPPEYQHVDYHMIFDITMGEKYCWVAHHRNPSNIYVLVRYFKGYSIDFIHHFRT